MSDQNHTAAGGNPTPEGGEKTFTQAELDRIVQERLARERSGAATVKAEFDAYREQAEAEKRLAREAKEKADAEAVMQKRFAEVSGSAKWINEHTRKGVYADFIAATTAPEYEGKTDKEIYWDLTTDQEGYFQNPNPPANMAGPKDIPQGWYDPIRQGMGLIRKDE